MNAEKQTIETTQPTTDVRPITEIEPGARSLVEQSRQQPNPDVINAQAVRVAHAALEQAATQGEWSEERIASVARYQQTKANRPQ